jgi:predicted nuclease of predicted toxin-antitoxin system
VPAIRLWLDECIDSRLVQVLRRRGYDVLAAGEEGTGGLEDVQQLAHATSLGRLLVSHNQVHFRRLHQAFQQQGRPHGGIILLPQVLPFARLEARVLLLLDWVAPFRDHQSRLFRWAELQQLLIHGFRLPHWEERQVRVALNWAPP